MRAACVARPAEFASSLPRAPRLVRTRALPRTLQDGPRVCVPSPVILPPLRVRRRRRAAGPTAADLLDFVRRTAADAELIASLPLDPEGRTWVRLDGPGGSEAWLIGWPPGTGTGWHDHAESVGAFTTAAGELKENSLAARLPTDGWKTLELTEDVDRHAAAAGGHGPGLRPHHVHEVLNESADGARDLGARLLPAAAADPPLQPHGPVLRLEQVERPEDWQ